MARVFVVEVADVDVLCVFLVVSQDIIVTHVHAVKVIANRRTRESRFGQSYRASADQAFCFCGALFM